MILVVEDDTDIRELMALHLRREGFSVQAVSDGEAALAAQTAELDLAILDWMLPGISGIDLCRRLGGATPILMVTARAEPGDIVAGLENGADDYLIKPFEIAVFLARVRALLRRSKKEASSSQSLVQSGPIRLNIETHEAVCGSAPLQLTLSEFRLLAALIQNQGRVLSRQQLIRLVQGEGISVTDRTIDIHVFGLRKKLGDHAELIETIRGVGYRVRIL